MEQKEKIKKILLYLMYVILVISVTANVLLILSKRKINLLYFQQKSINERRLNCPACPPLKNELIIPSTEATPTTTPSTTWRPSSEPDTSVEEAPVQEEVLLPPPPPAD